MPYGTMSNETACVLREQGITFTSPRFDDDGRPANGQTYARVDVIFAGTLDESFDIALEDNDVQAVVDATFKHITSRDYARGKHVCVDAYETNGEDYNEPFYVRETEG